MAKYKVLCNIPGCWTRTYDDFTKAKTASENHKNRKNHNPIYIYEIEDTYDYVASELPPTPDVSRGILKIHVI